MHIDMHLFIYIVRWALLASPLKSAPKSYLLFLIHLHPCRRKMYVVKRDGRHEMVHFDKITARLKKFSYGLTAKTSATPSSSRRRSARGSTRASPPASLMSTQPRLPPP
jgi:hypothetical protein